MHAYIVIFVKSMHASNSDDAFKIPYRESIKTIINQSLLNVFHILCLSYNHYQCGSSVYLLYVTCNMRFQINLCRSVDEDVPMKYQLRKLSLWFAYYHLLLGWFSSSTSIIMLKRVFVCTRFRSSWYPHILHVRKI